MFTAIKHKISTLVSDFKYYVARWQHSRNLPALEGRDRNILNALKKDGVYVKTLADLGLNSSSELLKAAYHQLSQMENANNDHLEQKWPQISTVTGLPEFYAWGIEKRLLNIIENYIGLPVAFHGVHLRKDFNNKHQFGTLLWHSDAEDRRIIKIFIYLNDVEQKTGPFEYIPRSLTSLFSWNYFRLYYKLWKSAYMGIDDEEVKPVIQISLEILPRPSRYSHYCRYEECFASRHSPHRRPVSAILLLHRQPSRKTRPLHPILG